MTNAQDVTWQWPQSILENFDVMVSADVETIPAVVGSNLRWQAEKSFKSALPATGKEETLRQISSAALTAIRIFSGRVGHLEVRVSELETYGIASTDRLLKFEQRLTVIEKALAKESLDDKEILEELAMLGGLKREEKQRDPFKLARGLLDMSEEDYEALLQEE